MFKLNLKIAFRNLVKNKVYTLVNVMGLALGLAGFIFVLLYVNHEKSYDHWDPQLKKVYQLQELDFWAIKEGKKEWMDRADLRIPELIKDKMPQIESVAFFNESAPQSVILDDNNPFMQEGIVDANEGFFSVFPFRFIYGTPESAFSKPGNVVIKESVALRYFGKINPVGKTIKINEQNWTTPETYLVTGVVADPVTPSSVDFQLIKRGGRTLPLNDNFYFFATVFVKLKSQQTDELLNRTLQNVYYDFKLALFKRQQQAIAGYLQHGLKPSARLVPLHQIHQEPLTGKSWLSMVKPVILLSALLFLISVINFVNMFTAQAVSRAKEVGIKKVIGAHRKSLILQFLIETALQCLIALLLSTVLLEGFLPYLNQLFNLDLSLAFNQNNLIMLAELVLLLLLVILMAGTYPAFFLSSYRPQNVLKGNFGHSHKGKTLRNLLVGLQFVIAVGFFIGIMVISRQMQYMENRDPGFSANAVIHIKTSFDKRIAAQLKSIDGVKYVGSNDGMISLNHKLTGKYRYNNESKELNTVLVNFEGLQALDVKLLQGRLFESHNAQDSLGTVILNESLEKAYGGHMIGKFIYVNDSLPAQVVGIIKDIQVAGFETRILPTVYTAANNNATGYPNQGVNYIVKFDQQKQKNVLAAINGVWKRQYPAFPFSYTYIQDDLSKVLVVHERFKEMVKLFSFLSISLSLIGLFALAAFLTKQRTKEIAIRKVLGADHRTLFLLLNKNYVWLMVIANVVSWPFIYIAVNHWLSGFAYRIDLPVLPFVIAFGVSIATTVLTVSIQVKNAVTAKPVDALKYE